MKLIALWAAVLLLAPLAALHAADASARRPNIILILADDLGWAELGCYGNRFNETPHLDGLAAQGLRFTEAYAAAPVCSPTRVSLMAGQWPARVGITDYLRPDDPKHLAAECVTLAEALQTAGYATGIIGKWHLSGYLHHGAQEIPPAAQGFEEVILSEDRGIAGGSYWFPYHFHREITQRLPGREYLVDRMNQEAVEFIERNRTKPFFLYLSHYAPHTALVGKPELVAKYEAKPDGGRGPRAPRNNPHLAAQLESIDQGVGLMLAKLEALGLADNTLVIFTSDNGGETNVTTNAPLRAGKSTLYEGGIREPLVIRWPGHIVPGGVCHTPVCSVDFYPTLCRIAGVVLDAGQKPDGTCLLPLWENPAASLPPRSLFWHYPLDQPHFLGGRSAGAIRTGDWKLIEFFDTGMVELYNLKDDLSEKNNLAEKLPEQAQRLRDELKAWRKQVGTETPQSTSPARPKR